MRRLSCLVLFTLPLILLSGCAAPALVPTVTPTPIPTATEAATETPIPTATFTVTPTPTPNAEATKQADFEAKKAEALKMVSIKLDTAEDLANLPVIDGADFDSGKVQEYEHWLIDNVLPTANITLPDNWRIESNTKTGAYRMGYDLITDSKVNVSRFDSAFFVKRDGKKILTLGVEVGGSGQLIHLELENPKWWTDPVRMKTLIAAFNNFDVIIQPVFGYGTIGDWSKIDNGYLYGKDSSVESYTVQFQAAHFTEFQQLAAYWVKNHKLPDGADKLLFGCNFYTK